MAQAKTRKKPDMSDEHLRALAKGRSESAVVRRYLVALENHKPRRGRKRTPESMKRRLSAIDQELKSADALEKLNLRQEKMDLEREIESNSDAMDLKAMEDDFVRFAKDYGDRKGISYQAWRESGVGPAVLKRAGITRAN